MNLKWLHALAVAMLVCNAAHAITLEGTIVSVSDGDTITLLSSDKKQERIRLNGIDAPESGQPFGGQSKANLARMVHGRNVIAQCHKIDRYRRHICIVMVAPIDCAHCDKSVDVGYAQVTAGLAWWYRQYAMEQSVEDRKLYESAEMEARSHKRGIWADPQPIPPWEWRRR